MFELVTERISVTLESLHYLVADWTNTLYVIWFIVTFSVVQAVRCLRCEAVVGVSSAARRISPASLTCTRSITRQRHH